MLGPGWVQCVSEMWCFLSVLDQKSYDNFRGPFEFRVEGQSVGGVSIFTDFCN